MTDPERDEEFEAYLRRRSMLPRREPAADRLEPPDDLDDIVLRKARQAIHSATPRPLYKAPRWALPVALAATILLTLSIALNVGLSNRGKPPIDRYAGPTGAPQAIARSEELARAPAVQPPESALAAAAPAPEADAAPPAPAPAPPSAVPARSEPQRHAPPPPPAAAPAAPPSPVAALAKRSPAAAPTTPESWLQRIATLRSQGKTTEADAELARFRAAFPAYPVTPDPSSPSGPPK